MRVTTDRNPKKYKIQGTVFLLEPASKDDLSKFYREAVYEMQNGDSTNVDPHMAEKIALKAKVKGWDETLLGDDDAPIPFNAGTAETILNNMDQSGRDELYMTIISPARNRAKLVATEKNA